jgi:ubiquinone/menaquinone biosynthesis C-methylase UbiE
MKEPPKTRFSKVAEDYARWRPSYPAMLVDWIALNAKLRRGARVADVGCGTGISTRLFAQRGYLAVGIDPNETMLAKAREAGGPDYVVGDEGSTGLGSSSIDLVTAAQAFHWFDIDKAQDEFARILKPSGFACAFWNLRSRTPMQLEYEALLRQHCTDWEEHPRGRQTIETILAHSKTLVPKEAKFAAVQKLDREGFFGRVHSASYVAHGLKGPKNFEFKLGGLFEKHAKDGVVDFEYDAAALLWKIK